MSILDEKWIFFYYKIDLIKPKEQTHNEFLEYCALKLDIDIINVVVGGMLKASYEVREGWFKLNKTVTAIAVHNYDDNYSILIRFNDITEELIEKWKKKPFEYIRYKEENDSREYQFSPVQLTKTTKIFHSIEFGLIARFGLKQFEFVVEEERMLMILQYDENGNPIITETDGIGLHSYPFEKRVKLYLEYPKVEKEVFGPWKFKDFVKWILARKENSEYDRQFCLKIEDILYSHGLEKLIVKEVK